jgi:hypothetical protein
MTNLVTETGIFIFYVHLKEYKYKLHRKMTIYQRRAAETVDLIKWS